MEHTISDVSAQYKLIHPLKHFRDYIGNNIRQDGRDFDKYRPIGINNGAFANCNGSSVVKLGKTNVICGIRAELCKPNLSAPDCGYLVPNVDGSFLLPSMNQNEVEALNCLLYNVLHDSMCVDLKELCISVNKLVWVLYMDLLCIEQDGGLLDAMILASVSALHNLKLPQIEYEVNTGKVTVTQEMRKLHLHTTPILTTHCKFDDKILMDPTQDEENMSSCSLLLGLTENSNVTLLHKIGGAPMNKSSLDESFVNATKREHDVAKLIATLDI